MVLSYNYFLCYNWYQVSPSLIFIVANLLFYCKYTLIILRK